MDPIERLCLDLLVVLTMLGLAVVAFIDDAATWLGDRFDACLEHVVGS